MNCVLNSQGKPSPCRKRAKLNRKIYVESKNQCLEQSEFALFPSKITNETQLSRLDTKPITRNTNRRSHYDATTTLTTETRSPAPQSPPLQYETRAHTSRQRQLATVIKQATLKPRSSTAGVVFNPTHAKTTQKVRVLYVS